ncbi:MAG TPA: SCO family protein [Candidatus Aquilonibacter sp.]|nr:SCO family protein [Candidatus Aquilonibacter sp.]
MSRIKNNSIFAAGTLLIAAMLPLCGSAQINSGITSPPVNERPPLLQNVGIEQHLDTQIPPNLTFVDDAGKSVKLGDYFGRKPLILNLVYFNCTMLCGEELAGLASAMRLIKFDVGNEFDIITVSFDPRETPAMAAAKKKDYVQRYGRANAASGWHFLTGHADSINALTKAVGFQYQYDPKTNQYAHATAIMILTPQGHISRYLYGVDFPPKDLRMGLVEASAAKIGNPVDAVLLYCYHYNPATGKYGAVIGNILRLAGAATILILGGMILILWRLDRSATRKAEESKTTYAQ